MAEEVRYPWQQQLLDAFLSAQRELPQKIALAETAIAARLQQSGKVDPAEQTALRDGLRALRVLISESDRISAETAEKTKRSAPESQAPAGIPVVRRG